MTKKVLLAIADGSEEIEAVTVFDLLKRAGAEVILASPEKGEVTLSHGLTVKCGTSLSEAAESSFDLIVMPGGLPGTYNLRDCGALDKIIERQFEKGGLVAAICAAPAFILGAKGYLEGKSATCYPGCEEGIEGVFWKTGEAVVKDGNIVTANGPGAAYLFALALVESLYGREFRQRIAEDSMFFQAN